MQRTKYFVIFALLLMSLLGCKSVKQQAKLLDCPGGTLHGYAATGINLELLKDFFIVSIELPGVVNKLPNDKAEVCSSVQGFKSLETCHKEEAPGEWYRYLPSPKHKQRYIFQRFDILAGATEKTEFIKTGNQWVRIMYSAIGPEGSLYDDLPAIKIRLGGCVDYQHRRISAGYENNYSWIVPGKPEIEIMLSGIVPKRILNPGIDSITITLRK